MKIPTHKKRQREVIFALLLLISLVCICSSTHADEEKKLERVEPQPAKRNHLSFLLGGYTMQSTTMKVSAPGAITVGYNYSFARKWSALVGYVNLLRTSPGISTIVSGFDFGVQYCFFNCAPEKRVYSGIIQVTEFGTFGVSAALGLSQRNFTLTNSTVGFSGPFVKIEGNYFINEQFRALVAIQQSSMSNSTVKLTYQSFSVGLGFDFGAGPGDILNNIVNINK